MLQAEAQTRSRLSRSLFAWAMLRLAAMGGRVIEAELPIGEAHEQIEDGRLALTPDQATRLEEILAQLVAMAEELETGREQAVVA